MSKKEKFELDDFDFDSELDFNFDTAFNKKTIKSDRRPVTETLKGVTTGATERVASYGFIRNLVRKALPRGYGDALDLSEKTAKNLKGLYDTTQREVKPMVDDLRKTVNRAIPHVEEKLPRSITDKLKSWSASKTSSSVPSEQEMRDAGIQLQLGDIFKAQVQLGARDKAKQEAKDSVQAGIEFGRHKDLVSQLDAMRTGIQRLASYQDNVGAAFQRKSLELQYRHYFLAEDAFRLQKENHDLQKYQLEAIAKNTGLPDYVKITKSESMEQLARNRFMMKAFDTVFNKHNSFFERVVGNAKESLKTKLTDFGYNFKQGLDGVDQMIDAKESMKAFKDLGMPVPSGFELGGNLAGSALADSVGGYLGGKIGKRLKGNDKINALGSRLAYISKFYPQLLEKAAKKPGGYNGFGSGLVDWAKEMITQNDSPQYSVETDKISDMYKPTPFTNRVSKSITDVIPGYLSRIFREIQVLRTGDTSLQLTHYNHEKNDFSTSDELITGLKNKLLGVENKKYFTSEMSSLIDMVDPSGKLSLDERKHLSEFLMKQDFHDKESLTDIGNYTGKAAQHREKYAETFNAYFKEDVNVKQLAFANKFLDVGSTIPDVRELAQTYVNLGYLPLLREIGIIDKNGIVNNDRIIQYYLSNDEPFTELKKKAAFRLNKKDKAVKTTSVKNIVNTVSTVNQTSALYTKDDSEIIAAIKDASSKPTAIEILEILKLVHEKLSKGVPIYGFTTTPPEGAVGGKWTDLPISALFGKFKNKASNAFTTAKDQALHWFDKAREYGQVGLNKIKDRGKIYLDKATDKINEFRDVYVKGEYSPRLILSKLREGRYAIMNPDGSIGKIIKSFKDITGDVVDADTGEIVLRFSELKNAFVKNKMGAVLLQKLGAAKDRIVGFSKYATLQFNNMYTMGFSLLKDGYLKVMDKLNEPQDVYVAGKALPALLAITMRAGGYTSTVTGKTIHSPKDIDGPVKNVVGDVVLSEEDIARGLLNKHGKPLRVGLGRITGFFKDKLSEVFGLGKKLGQKGVSGLKNVASRAGDFLQGKMGFSFGFMGDKTNSILLQIRNMLNDRLPGDKTSFDDSFLTSTPNSTGKGFTDFLSNLSNKTGSRINGLKDKFKNSGVIDTVKGFMSGIFGGLRGLGNRFKGLFSKLPSNEAIMVTGLAGMGELLSDIRDRLPKKPGLFSKFFGNKNEDRSALGMAGDALGGLAGASGGLGGGGEAKPGATKPGLWNKVKGFGGKVMGKLGSAAKVLGTLALGSLSIGDVLAGVGTLASGALSAGGAVMGGLGTLAAGIGSLISAPVVLGGLALAAVGVGGYYGYKYLSRKKLDGLNKLRYAQYGFMPGDTDHLEAVFGLEDKLKDGITFDNGVARIDDAKLKVKDVVSGFGVDLHNQEQLTNWAIWFSKRFKPVYLTHLTALNSVDSKVKLTDADDMDSDKLKRYLNIAKWPNGPYNVMQSPFPTLATLAAGDKEVASITAEVLEAVSKRKAPANVATGTIAQVATTTVQSGFQKPETPLKPVSFNPDVVTSNTTRSALPSLEMGKSLVFEGAAPLFKNRFASGKVQALDAVRYKTYGLKQMDLDKLKVLDALESYIDSQVFYSRKDVACWNGSPEEMLHMFGSQFGVREANTKAGFAWISWFTSRFLPVFLGYLTASMRVSGKKNIAGADALTAKEEYDVALAVVGTPVWIKTDSPWEGYSLNTQSSSVSDNMAGLEEKSRSVKLQDEVGKKASIDTTSNNVLSKTLNAAKDANETATKSSAQKSIWEKTKETVKTVFNNLRESAGNGLATVKEKATQVYEGARELMGMGKGSGGAVDNVPLPKGEGSWSALKDTILAASKMVGVDDKLMATMAAIESGFRYSVKAGTSSATGLYQFIKSTWDTMVKRYGGKYGISPNTPPTDPRANALMGAEYLRENVEALKGVVKRKLTDTDLYIAHFMGGAGAKKFLTADPNAIAATLFPDAARANRSIFYGQGDRPLTVAEVYNVINGRVRSKGKQFGLDSGASDIVSNAPQSNQKAAGGVSGSATGGISSLNEGGSNAANKAPNGATASAANPNSGYTQTGGGMGASTVPGIPSPPPPTTPNQAKMREDNSIYQAIQKSTDSLVEINRDQLGILKAILEVMQVNQSSKIAPPKKLMVENTPTSAREAPSTIVAMTKPSYG